MTRRNTQGIGALSDSFAFEHLVNRIENESHILTKRHVTLVDEVVADPLAEREVVAAKYLGKTRETGADSHAFPARTQGKRRHLLGDPRPGANQAHVPHQHIQQLGQFVDRRRAQKRSQPSRPFLIGQQYSVSIALIRHRLEFDDRERFEVAAYARLDKKRIPPERDPQTHRQDNQYWQQTQQSQRRGNNIEPPLHHPRIKTTHRRVA